MAAALRTTVDRFLQRHFDHFTVQSDRSGPNAESCVVEVQGLHGTRWFAKGHRDAVRYRRERTAYRRWVPMLGEQASQLHAHDDEAQVLLLTALPGATPLSAQHATDPAIHQQAGRLLRRLHDTQPLAWPDSHANVQLAAFEPLAVQARPLLDQRTLDFVRSELLGLTGLEVEAVPCHLDYSPRNWLTVGTQLAVVDFEWAGAECWVNDLARLAFGPWQLRPDLRAALLDGYGRTIQAEERAVLLAYGALRTLFLICWARQHADQPFEAANRQTLADLMRRVY